jgi:hypothetical protein
MTRILVAFAVLAALVLAPAVGATAPPAAPVLKVDIKAGQVRLLPDGSVPVPLRARCSLDAFELDLSVVQGSAIGGEQHGRRGVPHLHRDLATDHPDGSAVRRRLYHRDGDGQRLPRRFRPDAG